jgi:hypothetical protein
MIVLKIHIGNGTAVQPERDPPIACDRNAILAFATTLQGMQFPPGQGRDLSQIVGKLQSRKNSLNLGSGLGRHTVRVIIVVQRLQALVTELSDQHAAVYGTTVHMSSAESASCSRGVSRGSGRCSRAC